MNLNSDTPDSETEAPKVSTREEFRDFLHKANFPQLGSTEHSPIIIGGKEYEEGGKNYKVYIPSSQREFFYSARQAGEGRWRIMCFDKKQLLPAGQVDVVSHDNMIKVIAVATITPLNAGNEELLLSTKKLWRAITRFALKTTPAGTKIQILKVEDLLALCALHYKFMAQSFAANSQLTPVRKAFEEALKEVPLPKSPAK